MIPVVGVAGRRRHGKDTLSGFLAMCYGYRRVAFADALKEDVARKLFIPPSWLDTEHYKERYRPELVAHGMAMREADPEYWIKRARLEERAEAGEWLVVSDVRMPNEVAAVRALGGKIVFVALEGEPLTDDNAAVNAAERLMPWECDAVLPHKRTPASLVLGFERHVRARLGLPELEPERVAAWAEDLESREKRNG